MNRNILTYRAVVLSILAVGLFSARSSDDGPGEEVQREPTEPIEDIRWITIVAARMGDKPGDGNGGTLIYSLRSEEAKDPTVSIEPFDNGFIVPSNRTARLQASEDGNTIFNISYAGDTGGNYTKYTVEGGQNFAPTGS